MKSIRSELAAKLVGAALGILLIGGGGFYFSLREALRKQFDNVLISKAGALAMASEIEKGQLEIDLDVQAFAGFGTGARGDYFAVFGEDGIVLMRSPSLGSEELKIPEALSETEEGVANILLPEDVPGRAYWTTYEPSLDNDEAENTVPPNLKMLVAGSDATLRRTLRTAALFTWIFGGCGILLTLAIARSVIASGLKSLGRMSEEVETIDVGRLDRRLSIDGMPEELRVTGAKVNELLARLEDSFGREKRFTSNAAHELRTPLAELRTMTELGTRWPDEFTEEHGNEMLEVISELEALLGTLSLLARAESEATPMTEPVDLPEFVSEQIDRVRPTLAKRHLEIDTEIGDGEFRSDPVLFRAILQNLVDNAVNYAPEKTTIRIEANPDRLLIENEAPDLEQDDLANLFARFWRKSQSRSEKGHSGLGLSVVRAGAEHLGGQSGAELVDGRLRVAVDWSRENQ